ncbi:MAG: hypothetical protein ABIE84_04875 [bacterium]
MNEEKQSKNVDDLLAQIDKFKMTIAGLGQNIDGLKQKLQTNKEKYGADISQWPKEDK